MNNHSVRRVGILGFRGYSGAELLHILSGHPGVQPVLVEHRSDAPAHAVPLGAPQPPTIAASPEALRAAGIELVFFATPPEVSMDLAGPLLQLGIKVIDLSGAFRLGDAETYLHWYKHPHTSPELFSQAVYGLPEFYRDRIRSAELLSNPGCYPTSVNLALRPLVRAGVVDLRSGVICDAKSGVSGAGRKPSLKTAFSEVTENFSAYGFNDHRHVPEVLQNSGLKETEFTFTAQLLPIHRGILETIYLQTTGVGSGEDVLAIYRDAYRNEPFVRLYSPGEIPDLRAVQHTNFCDIGFRFDPASRRLMIVAVEDNLGKGAAGQAVQNMNLMFGFPETEALL